MLACIRKKLYLCIAIERNGVKRGLEKTFEIIGSIQVWKCG